ncbi:MAG: HEAT repeat domain-containing protein [Desulfotomaculales bacterium]
MDETFFGQGGGKIPEIERLFRELAGVSDPVRREEIVLTLLRINTKEVVSGFLNLLLSSDPALRSAALEALQIMADEHLEQIALCLFAADRDLRLLVLVALTETRNPRAAGPVRRLLQAEETDENILAAALEALGELGDRSDLALVEQVAREVRKRGGHQFLDFLIQKTKEKLILKRG